jgi:hypothetical protein
VASWRAHSDLFDTGAWVKRFEALLQMTWEVHTATGGGQRHIIGVSARKRAC